MKKADCSLNEVTLNTVTRLRAISHRHGLRTGKKINCLVLGKREKCTTDNSVLFVVSPLDHKNNRKGTVGKEGKRKFCYVARSTMLR